VLARRARLPVRAFARALQARADLLLLQAAPAVGGMKRPRPSDVPAPDTALTKSVL